MAALLALTAEVEELKRRLGVNSGNSSTPPSADPPKTRAERRRDARAAAKRSMKASARKNVGGQPGHPGAHRERVADPDRTVEHRPSECSGCGGDLAAGELLGGPVCHQVWELPEASCVVTEHQRLRVLCQGCGKPTLADLAPGTPGGAFGPRLSATIVGLCAHMSREQVAVFVTDNFGCPISAASVEAICKRASTALAGTWDQLASAVREQPAVHADETGWRWPGKQRWAWLASTKEIAVYLLAETRTGAVAKQLLGENFQGVLISDRYAGYNWIDPDQRQFCWPHLLRDYQALADRGGRVATLGRALKNTSREILHVYHQHERQGRLVAWDSPELLPLHDRLMDLFEQGSRMHDQKTSRFCSGLLKLWPALWNFTEFSGVDPSNNRAERALRFAVLLRKRSGGTRNDDGDRFIERLLTVRETCRLQGKSLHDHLLAAITAALHGQPAPSLLPAGP